MANQPTYQELEHKIIELEKEVVKSKQAGETLRETEERFRTIYDESPIGIEIYDATGQLLHVNKACLDIFGIVEERQTKGFRLFDDPNLPDKGKSKLRKGKMVRYEATFDFDLVKKHELYTTTKSGIAYLEVVITPFALKENDCTGGYLVQIQDNTERKLAKVQVLRQSKVLEGVNKVFREVLTCESDKEIASTCLSVAEELTDSKFGLIGEVNPDGRFNTIAISNPGWDACKMLGPEATRSIENMEIRGIDRSVIREGKSRIVNNPASHPDRVGTPEGHPPITSFLGVPLKYKDKTIGMIGMGNKESGYDLADQQSIEALSIAFVEALMRKRAEIALRREREKFRVLVEESPLGVSLIGEDGVYQYVNPRFIELFGYTLKDIPNGREWFRKAHPDPKYRTQVISTWNNELKVAKKDESRPYTFTVICKDGSEKVVQFIAVAMETGGQFVIYEDLTEQKKLEEQFHQAQKMEAIGTLAGGVAHDFNNILTTIIGYAALALVEVGKDESLRREIKEIKKAGERAAALIRQLLAFSRKQVIKPEVLDLNNVINATEKMLKRMIAEDIEFKTVLKPELWKVHMDSGQVDQIIINLAVNAGDAMPQGGKLIVETANVDLDKNYLREHGIEGIPGHYVMLAVSDTGSGINKENQEHIFEPFFTTKEIGKGTGLGLSTVYGISKQNNGFIWVYSEPGQGTTFKIYLPKVKEGTEPEKKERTPVGDFNGSETVLIVEDDDSLRKFAQKTLQHYGYRMLVAENGEDALRISKEYEGSIDLMITDVVMPKMGGKQVAERLQPLYPQMKVIYMSGYTDNAIAHHGVLEPGLNFIEKPFTPEVLARKVREVLDR